MIASCFPKWQTVEALVEFSQGFSPNQAVVFDEHVIDHINFLLRYPINCEPGDVCLCVCVCACVCVCVCVCVSPLMCVMHAAS